VITVELSEIQKKQREFILERRWNTFPASQVFAHLLEELGEIASYLLYAEGYKKEGLGHKRADPENLPREFAQAFNLFLQLAIHFDINLEQAWKAEIARMETRFKAIDWQKYLKTE
jgi:NTP pyrophosphatase (non-canonical NTP hydrolase)